MKCPTCQLGEEHQIDDPDDPHKSQCTGCKAKFFNKDKV